MQHKIDDKNSNCQKCLSTK